jgi:hypothetical protein
MMEERGRRRRGKMGVFFKKGTKGNAEGEKKKAVGKDAQDNYGNGHTQKCLVQQDRVLEIRNGELPLLILGFSGV